MSNTKKIYHKWSLFTTSKMNRHSLHQKVRQRISVMKTNTMFSENWHFNSHFVLKTKKHQCLFLLLFDLINDDQFFML
jgi:hypothetical protein